MRRAPRHVGSTSRDPTGAGIHNNRSDGRIDHDVRVLRQAVAAVNWSAAAAGQVAGHTLVYRARLMHHTSRIESAVGWPRARATTDTRVETADSDTTRGRGSDTVPTVERHGASGECLSVRSRSVRRVLRSAVPCVARGRTRTETPAYFTVPDEVGII